MKRYFGAHVSTAGGLVNAAVNGHELGVNTIQVHPSPPQRWNTSPYPPDFEKKFKEKQGECGIEKVFFHGIYLINLASPDERLQQLGRSSLAHYLDLMDRIGGEGVIFHVGSLKDEADEEEGYRRAAGNINRILEAADNSARLLLEVSAGGGAIIGDRVEELRTIYDMVDQQERVGFALDTQHLWASGYDLAGNLEGVLSDITRSFPREKIAACHVNDSLTAMGSRRDRHANIGKGLIGEDALRRVLNHPALSGIPLILETPGLKSMDTAKEEVKALAQLLQDDVGSAPRKRSNERG